MHTCYTVININVENSTYKIRREIFSSSNVIRFYEIIIEIFVKLMMVTILTRMDDRMWVSNGELKSRFHHQVDGSESSDKKKIGGWLKVSFNFQVRFIQINFQELKGALSFPLKKFKILF